MCLLVIEQRPGRRPVKLLDSFADLGWVCADGATEVLDLPVAHAHILLEQKKTLGLPVFDSDNIDADIDLTTQTPVAFFDHE